MVAPITNMIKKKKMLIHCREAGELMTNGSKCSIAVSTVKEAEFFAQGGFDDILYAFPFTKDKMPR